MKSLKETRFRVRFGDLDGVRIAFSFSVLWFQTVSALIPFWVWLVLRIHMWSPCSRPYKIHAQTLGSAIVFSIQKRKEGNVKPTEWKPMEWPGCLFWLLWAKVELSLLKFFVLELFFLYQSNLNYMNKLHQWLT